MSDAVFPSLPGLAWDVVKRPQFATIVQRAASGREVRAALWAAPIWEWDLTYDLLRDDASDELKTLLGFFLQRQGAFDSFLFSDPSDNAVSGQALGIGDGANMSFQLVRAYGGFVEPIQDLNGGASVRVDGVIKATPADYAIDGTGLVSFVVAPANGAPVSADFAFYRRVRFKEDLGEFTNFAARLWQARQLTLVSIKP